MRPLLSLLAIAVLCTASRARADMDLPVEWFGPTLRVDLTDAPRGLFHATEAFGMKTGRTTLTYVLPRWIPGEHGPAGPIGDIVGIDFEVSGTRLPWTRD